MTTCQFEWRRCQGTPQKCLLTLYWSHEIADLHVGCWYVILRAQISSSPLHLPKIIYDFWGSPESRVTSGEVLHHPEDSCTAWGCQQPPVWHCTISTPLEHKHQSWRAVDEPTKTSEQPGDRHLHEQVSCISLMSKTSQWQFSDVKGWNHHIFLQTNPVLLHSLNVKTRKTWILQNISPGKTKVCQRI